MIEERRRAPKDDIITDLVRAEVTDQNGVSRPLDMFELQDLLDAMETLERDHPQFVEPLLLRDVYGLSYDEIAQLVDAPLGTVKAQIHHGRKLVRPLLREGE